MHNRGSAGAGESGLLGARAPRRPGRPTGRYQGFTLVELVACIVIIGVLAAVAGPRFFTTLPFQQRGYVDEVAGAVRYAQRVAIASDCSVAFTVDAAGYSAALQAGTGPVCPSTLVPTRADRTPLSGAPPAGVTVAPATTSFTFLGTGAVSGGVAPAPIVVGSYTLTVVAGSGLVTVQ